MSDPPSKALEWLLRDALSRTSTEPPGDFAQATAALVSDAPEAAQPEILASRALLGLGALATGWSIVLSTGEVTARLGPILERAPWPLLVVSAAALIALKAAEVARR